MCERHIRSMFAMFRFSFDPDSCVWIWFNSCLVSILHVFYPEHNNLFLKKGEKDRCNRVIDTSVFVLLGPEEKR